MKVLHVIDSGGVYGAEVMLLSLMEEQLALGLSPVLASIGEPGQGEKPLEREARLRAIAVTTFRMRPGPNLAGLLSLLRFVRLERVDLIHCHGYKANIFFGLLPRPARRVPVVSTVHGWTWTGGFTRMMLYEWLDALSLTRMDRVILVNRLMRDHPRLKSRPGLPLEVVPNGIVERAGVASAAGLHPQVESFCRRGPTILAIGRLSAEKGFDLLVEAVSQLVAAGQDVRLVILGEGEQRGELTRQVKLRGLEDRVLMPGYLENARSYLPVCAVFALPSHTEGLPIVLLEAMQAGVPVVATRVGGVPDVLQEGRGGLLVDPGKSESLQQGILEVLARPEVARDRATAAQKRVEEQFSSKAMAEKYYHIYLNLGAGCQPVS